MIVVDRVAYKASVFKSICCFTGDLPQARGNVVELTKLGQTVIVTVEWDRDTVPPRANKENLCKVGGSGFSSQ